ncbi:MAG: hypothetical protein SOZ59_02220 [Candidatus Limivivens sp.]|nr:hypothetical protein [Candidatus Limivivens sp.]
MYKKLLTVGLCVCLAAGTLTGCGSDAAKTVIQVGDTKIEYSLVNFMLRYNQSQMQSWYGSFLGDDYWTTYGTQSRDSIVEDLEEMVLLEQHMDEYGVSLSDEEKSSITDAAAAFMEANEKDTLEAMNATQEVAERALTLYTIRTKMYNAIIADVDTNVTDEEAAQKTVRFAYFSTGSTTDEDGNSVERTDEEKEEIKAQAQQVLDAVKAGTDMDEALAEVDETKTSTTSSYGADNGTLSDVLKEEAEKLTEDGQVAENLIEAETGYYVLQMMTTFDEEATESQKETIISERKSDLYTEVTDGWKESTEIKTEDKLLEKMDFTDTWQLKETETESEAETEAVTAEAASETEAMTTEAASETEEVTTEAASETEAVTAEAASETEAVTTEAASETEEATTEAE